MYNILSTKVNSAFIPYKVGKRISASAELVSHPGGVKGSYPLNNIPLAEDKRRPQWTAICSLRN